MSITVRVGLVGAGKIGRIHAKGYGQLAGVRIAAVADVNAQAGQALASEYGADYFPDYEALLRADVDAVSVGLPDRLHHQVAMAAATSGKHILLEKPMCATLAEAEEIISACRAHGVKLMLGFRHRFHSEIQMAKRLIEEGRLGRTVLAQDALSGGGPPDSGAWTPWYWDKSLAMGGILTSAGIHGIDRLLWLVNGDIEEVHAYMGTFGHEGELEDNLVSSLRFNDGAIGSIVQNFNFYTLPGKYDLDIYGTEGAVRIRTGQTLEFASKKSQFVHSVERDDPFGKEIAEFVSAIRQDREPAITGEDGRISLAVALAIYRSAESGTPVKIRDILKESRK
jgi:UDP-N-acetyl-2-amino-2-deoxyglucuronate dehydrogenase